MIKIVILEDEETAATRLQKLVAEILPEAEFDATITNVKQGIEWFRNNSLPQLVFADIQLSDGTSFDIIKEVPVPSAVIFTTAYDAHALNAFKLNSVDYLLKPIKKAELAAAIEKFKNIYISGKQNSENNLQELLQALQKTQ